MRYLFLSVLFSIGLARNSTGQSTELEWLTDFEIAKSQAQKNDNPILLRFQGSDWCGNCWRLDSTLFETKAFQQYVEEKFTLVVLDFPNKPENKLPEIQAAKNKKFLEKYNQGGGFPALYMLNSEGEVMGKMSVTPKPTEEYIENLKEILIN